uniref:Imidazoleglycerol-phosphate dehydratase n=1 Tax=uncultured Chloroflexota bacterium TaxID=166587 RepID=H5SBG5_9CHLR|nr:imidazole glycerol phosphate dehydratase [uncultured Chloroflexota bacterium]
MRKAEIHRQTRETRIHIALDLDGTGEYEISTGLGFLDHCLSQLAVHGLFNLQLQAQGDLEVDAHHTVEDVALALGQAFDQALGERRGLVRMGHAVVPMDEALAQVALDLSGRPYARVQARWHTPYLGTIPVTLIPHFFRSFSVAARCTLHARVRGEDDHHQAEALFKALARALEQATQIDPRRGNLIPSSKGSL